MKKRIALGIVAVVLGAWAILPDPIPVAIDDVIAGLGSAASILAVLVSIFKKKQKDEDA